MLWKAICKRLKSIYDQIVFRKITKLTRMHSSRMRTARGAYFCGVGVHTVQGMHSSMDCHSSGGAYFQGDTYFQGVHTSGGGGAYFRGCMPHGIVGQVWPPVDGQIRLKTLPCPIICMRPGIKKFHISGILSFCKVIRPNFTSSKIHTGCT